MNSNFIIRISDGENFKRSVTKKIWGIKTKTTDNKTINSNIYKLKPGDKLWFAKSGKDNKIAYIATFVKAAPRQLGPLIDISLNNNEIGWVDPQPNGVCDWDVELHYKDLYYVSDLNLKLNFNKNECPRNRNVILFKSNYSDFDVETEYTNISKYSKVIHY